MSQKTLLKLLPVLLVLAILILFSLQIFTDQPVRQGEQQVSDRSSSSVEQVFEDHTQVPQEDGLPARSNVQVVLPKPSKTERAATSAVLVKALRGRSELPYPELKFQVHVVHSGEWRSQTFSDGLTDASGSLRLEVPPELHLRLAAEWSMEYLYEEKRLEPLKAGEVRQVEFRVYAREKDRAMVQVTNTDELPLSEVRLTAMEEGQFEETKTDAAGIAHLELWGPGWFRVKAEKSGFALTFANFDSEEAPHSLVMVPEAVLKGIVKFPDLESAASATVRLSTIPMFLRTWFPKGEPSWHCISDSEGRFQIDGLPPSCGFLIEIQLPSHSYAGALAPLEIGVTDAEFILYPHAELHGLVLDPAGKPAPGIQVELERQDLLASEHGEISWKSSRFSVNSDAHGEFVLGKDGRLGPGLWRIGLAGLLDQRVRSGVEKGPAYSYLADVQEVEIQAGTTRNQVVLHMRRGLFISGYLFDDQGKPLAEGYVSAQPDAELRAQAVRSTQLDTEGRFRVGPLVPGRFRLKGGNYSLGLVGEVEAVEAGTSEVTIHCHSLTRIRGRLLDPQNNGMHADGYLFERRGSQTIMYAFTINGAGDFDRVVEPGTYDIFVFHRSGLAAIRSNIRVGKGQTAEISLQMEPGARFYPMLPDDLYEEEYLQLRFRDELVFEGPSYFLESLLWIPQGPLQADIFVKGLTRWQSSAFIFAGQTVELEWRLVDSDETRSDH